METVVLKQMSWKQQFKRLGTEEEDNLAKLMLTHMAKEMDTTPLELYRTFLKATLSLTLSHGNLASMSPELLNRFYGVHPRAAPKYLDIRKAASLSKLGQALRKNIVLLRPPPRKGGCFYKLSDRSIYKLASGEEVEKEIDSLIFLVDLEKKRKKKKQKAAADDNDEDEESITGWTLYVSQSGEPVHRDECEAFMIEKAAPKTGCFIERLSVLLQLQQQQQHVHVEEVCGTMAGLCCNGKAVHEMLGGKTNLILASHLGANLRVSRSTLPKTQLFGQLCFVRENDDILSSKSLDEVRVVLATPSGRLYIPHQDYADIVRYPQRATVVGSRHPKSLSYPGLSKGKESWRQHRDRRREKEGEGEEGE